MANSIAIRAGRAFVELFADDSKLVRGLRQAEKKLKAFGNKLQGIGKSMLRMGTALALPQVASVKVFAGFDDQMRAVQAVIGATADEFDLLNDKAKLLGRTTSFTAARVASAMLELGRAGFSSGEIDDAITDVLSLARATGTELAEAAGIASNTLRAFNLEAADAARVADVMTATANTSAQTLTDLGEAMKYAAPVADEFGLSLEETSKVLGALANYGIKGSMAGTTIKQIMTQLADPAIRKTMGGLGVAVTDAAGNFRGLSGILRDLGGAMENMPQADRLALFDQLFGKRAIAGGAKLTAASFDRLNDAIDHAAGAAGRTAKVMDSGIGGALRRLWSAVEGIAIAVGDSLAPVLSRAADWLANLSTAIAEWIQRNGKVILTIAGVTVALLAGGVALLAFGKALVLAGAAFGALVTVVGVVHTALTALAAVIGFMVTPIGAVIAAVAALGGYLVYATGAGGKALAWLGERFEVLKNEALSAYRGIADALAAGDIALAAKVLWLTLKMEWTRGINFLEKAWLDFRNFFAKIGYDAFHGAVALMQTVWHGLEVAWIESSSWMSKVWTNFTSDVMDAWEIAQGWLTKRLLELQSQFDDTFDVDTAKALVDRETNRRLVEIEDRRGSALRENESRRAAGRKQSEALHEATLAEIGRANLDKHKELDTAYTQEMKKNEADLAKARQEWRAALDEARGKRERKDAGTDGPGKIEGPEAALKKAMAGLGDIGKLVQEQAEKIGVVGTFSASALAGLGSSSAADRTAKATEETARGVKKLNRKAETGELVFG